MSKDLNQTHNFPLNNSLSKQLYSFPKANRFQTAREPTCKNAFYQIKRGAFGTRATSFGYGNKIDLANKQDVPEVGRYKINGQFVDSKQKNKGYTFGRNSKANSLINPQKTAKSPGPGAYYQNKQKSIDKYATISYSMGHKLEDNFSKNKINIGPGQYQYVPSLNSKGNYFLSKYTSSGCPIMGHSKRKSLNENSITPGPGNYQDDLKINMNKTGVYFNSKYRNMEAGKFGKSNRPSLANITTVPGPGSYGQFSEFAHVNRSWVRSSTIGK